MEKLTTFYRGTVIAWAAILVIGTYYFVTMVVPAYASDVPILLKLVLSFGFIALVFRLGEVYIRNYLWRSNPILRFFGYYAQDRLDFDGLWYGETLYKVREQDDGGGIAHEPFRKTHEVRIEQDATTISVQPTPGDAFATWRSLAATVEADVLRFLYHVTYSDRENFPDGLYGHEWMAPKRRTHHQGGKGKPILLHGGFGHCVGGGKPNYSGETVYIRKGHGSTLTAADLPESFQDGLLARQLGTLE